MAGRKDLPSNEIREIPSCSLSRFLHDHLALAGHAQVDVTDEADAGAKAAEQLLWREATFTSARLSRLAGER